MSGPDLEMSQADFLHLSTYVVLADSSQIFSSLDPLGHFYRIKYRVVSCSSQICLCLWYSVSSGFLSFNLVQMAFNYYSCYYELKHFCDCADYVPCTYCSSEPSDQKMFSYSFTTLS